MKRARIEIQGIPALVWGEPSDKVYLCVHGKMSSKESAQGLAEIAEEKGYQTISFDLPRHGILPLSPVSSHTLNGIAMNVRFPSLCSAPQN